MDDRLIRDSVERFAARELAPMHDALNHYPDTPLPAALVAGLDALGLLEGLGAATGGDARALAEALEALAQTAAAAAGVVFAHALARDVAGAAAAGARLLAYPAYAEAEGLDPGVACRAPGHGQGDELVLDGTADFVANAPIAARLVIPVAEAGGVSLFVVDPAAPGVRVGPPLLTLGLRGAPVADVFFEGARVPAAARLAGPPAAARAMQAAARRFRGPALAISAGLAAASARAAARYARDRYQGGRQIVDHPQVRAMLAGMLAAASTCRAASARLCAGDVPEPEATLLFTRAREAAAHAAVDGVQLLGGYGYMEDYGQERCMRDAKQAQALLGRGDALEQQAMDAWASAEVTP